MDSRSPPFLLFFHLPELYPRLRLAEWQRPFDVNEALPLQQKGDNQIEQFLIESAGYFFIHRFDEKSNILYIIEYFYIPSCWKKTTSCKA